MIASSERRSLAQRRADAGRDAILEAAWNLSRRDGLTGWSLRELAREVGLTAPSLYAYFENKHAIYDAMFAQGYEHVDALAATWVIDHAALRRSFAAIATAWHEFCTSDPTRYQLMFRRVIPDFVPSDDAYAASLASYDRFRRHFAEVGITDDEHLDLWTAIASGLADQQISNDPGGDRWGRLVAAAVDLFCDHVGIPTDPT